MEMSLQRGVRIAVVGWLIIGSGVLAASCQRRSAETPDQAASARKAIEDSLGILRLERGQQAYLASCAMCHGVGGAGDGPLSDELRAQGVTTPARLNDRARLDLLGHEELVRVISMGGAHTGRSNLMPPWGEKLAPALIDTIADYVMALPDLQPGTPASTLEAYLAAPPGTPEEGRRLFVFYCTSCHGPYGKGDGFLADTLWARNQIRPRDLTDSTYLSRTTDQQLYVSVSLGGAHSGKSMFMPAWTATLQPAQIRSLVSYVRAISGTPSRP
jgi:mono/diheme cytochrome c family protein